MFFFIRDYAFRNASIFFFRVSLAGGSGAIGWPDPMPNVETAYFIPLSQQGSEVNSIFKNNTL